MVFSPAYYSLLGPSEGGYALLILESAKFARDYAKKIKQKYQTFDRSPLKVDGKVIEVKRIDALLDRISCRILTFGKALPNPINQVSVLIENKLHKFAYYGDLLGKKDDLVELSIYPMSRIKEFEEFREKVLKFIEVNPFPELIEEYSIKDMLRLGIPGEENIIRIIQEVPKTKLQNLGGIITNYEIMRDM